MPVINWTCSLFGTILYLRAGYASVKIPIEDWRKNRLYIENMFKKTVSAHRGSTCLFTKLPSKTWTRKTLLRRLLPPPLLCFLADAALCHLRGESRKALQSGMLKGKHIFKQIWQSQHKFKSQRKGALSNAPLFRLLYVQINSHFVYIEPLGWKKQNTISLK